MEKPLEDYRQYFEQLSILDASKLSSKLNALIKRRDQNLPFDRQFSEFEHKLALSLDNIFQKQKRLPLISYPDNLPVTQKRQAIAEQIKHHQVVILAGETGSGKTTQLPKICLDLGRGLRGQIGHTQPRRIAATTVAARIAEELHTDLGSIVGYQVRFSDHTDNNTFVKLMTDGILLAEIQNDPLLLKYDTLIIDEAHERSLNIDFLLGYLKKILPKRPDLKLIITSATIDLERFSEHFNKAPIIEVKGRTYSVETLYRPWDAEHADISEAIVAVVDEITSTQKRGDILVFLSGERDIREVSHALKKADFPHLDILPLYARLSLADQNRIFASHTGTRVVLATNVAETSVTVPGIRYVIDPGYARISRYSVRTKVQRLPIEAISQASANQRMGRCGRVSEGRCYRLYSEEDFKTRPEYTDAEILRTNLAAVILQMLQMRIGKVRDFPFVDVPESKLINDGFKLLEELKAVDRKGTVTALGKQLGNLPIDPRLGAVVIEAARLNCLREALIIVAALSIPDPRERPADKKQAADELHRRFADQDSDFVAYINLWEYLEQQRQELSQNQLRKLCNKEYINYLRMREWRELHFQLKLAIKPFGFKENSEPSSYQNIHCALICGFVSQLGILNPEKDSRDYLGTRQKKFTVFPGSSQVKKRHKWILSAQFIETNQLYAHCVAKVESEWVLPYAEHLSKYHYFEPHYDVKQGQVCAYRQTSLLGLILEEKKRVIYGKIDPEQAHDIFIREALVEGKYRGKGEFFKHNRDLIEHIHELEAKARRRDILVNEEHIFQFYKQRVPAEMANLAAFEYWLKSRTVTDPTFLHLQREHLMLHDADDISQEQFPSYLNLGDLSLPVSYCFEPGKINDGVNLTVPVELLHEIPEAALDWVVPGILREKCIALVKALPKSVRKHFVPVPQFVDQVLPRLKPKNVPLTESLGDALGHIGRVSIPAESWDFSSLDSFYRINIQVVDDLGRVIDQSRNIEQLRKKYRMQVQKTLQRVGEGIEKSGIKTWDFGRLEESVSLDKGSVKIKAYPTLKIERDSVDLKLIDNPLQAEYETRRGLLRLASLGNSQSTKYLKQKLMKGKELGLTQVNLGSKDEVIDALILAATDKSLFRNQPMPRNREEFDQLVQKGRAEIVASAEQYELLLVCLLEQVVRINKTIRSHPNPLSIALAAKDIRNQLDNLIFKEFLLDVSDAQLAYFERYLRAIEIRLEKIAVNGGRDRQWSDCIDKFWQQHTLRLEKEGKWAYLKNDAWQSYRWMIEELRVSFFAQTLKTPMPVSEKRLRAQWEASLNRQ